MTSVATPTPVMINIQIAIQFLLFISMNTSYLKLSSFLFLHSTNDWETCCAESKVVLETQNGFTTLMLDWFPIVFHMHEQNEPCRLLLPRKGKTQCLKIIKKVSFNIASEASYAYNLSGQK